MYALKVITPPAAEPVTLDEMKQHLREDLSDQDSLITSLIGAAREYAENFMGRAFITQTLELILDRFPWNSILLPRPPLQSVTSVKYIDPNGVEQTISSGDYQVISESHPAEIVPDYGIYWPTALSQPSSLRVRYVAGYGGASAVPATIKAAVRLLAAHWYENREATVLTGATVQTVPLAVESLLWMERVVAF